MRTEKWMSEPVKEVKRVICCKKFPNAVGCPSARVPSYYPSLCHWSQQGAPQASLPPRRNGCRFQSRFRVWVSLINPAEASSVQPRDPATASSTPGASVIDKWPPRSPPFTRATRFSSVAATGRPLAFGRRMGIFQKCFGLLDGWRALQAVLHLISWFLPFHLLFLKYVFALAGLAWR